MVSSLFFRLVLPLVVLFTLAMFLHTRWEADGFFVNLATELIGILITVCYVEWILQRHEMMKWGPVDWRIEKRLTILLNGIISGIRNGLGFDTKMIDDWVAESFTYPDVHTKLMSFGQQVLGPNALSRLESLDRLGWQTLMRHIEQSKCGVRSFLQTFQSRMTPSQIADLLELEESLEYGLTWYSMFPELLGVPDEELPKTKTPPNDLRRAAFTHTAQAIANVCLFAKRISESMTGSAQGSIDD